MQDLPKREVGLKAAKAGSVQGGDGRLGYMGALRQVLDAMRLLRCRLAHQWHELLDLLHVG